MAVKNIRWNTNYNDEIRKVLSGIKENTFSEYMEGLINSKKCFMPKKIPNNWFKMSHDSVFNPALVINIVPKNRDLERKIIRSVPECFVIENYFDEKKHREMYNYLMTGIYNKTSYMNVRRLMNMYSKFDPDIEKLLAFYGDIQKKSRKLDMVVFGWLDRYFFSPYVVMSVYMTEYMAPVYHYVIEKTLEILDDNYRIEVASQIDFLNSSVVNVLDMINMGFDKYIECVFNVNYSIVECMLAEYIKFYVGAKQYTFFDEDKEFESVEIKKMKMKNGVERKYVYIYYDALSKMYIDGFSKYLSLIGAKYSSDKTGITMEMGVCRKNWNTKRYTYNDENPVFYLKKAK